MDLIFKQKKLKKELKEELPDLKLFIVDSTCASSGFGMFTEYVYDEKQKGKSIEEVYDFALKNNHLISHFFYSTDLKYFKASGRLSNFVAFIGGVLKICPVMRITSDGKIVAYGKTLGKFVALKRTVEEMEKNCDDGLNYSGKLFISSSNAPEEANKLKQLVLERFKNIKESDIKIYEIGEIITSHCGPGTVALYFHSKPRY